MAVGCEKEVIGYGMHAHYHPSKPAAGLHQAKAADLSGTQARGDCQPGGRARGPGRCPSAWGSRCEQELQQRPGQKCRCAPRNKGTEVSSQETSAVAGGREVMPVHGSGLTAPHPLSASRSSRSSSSSKGGASLPGAPATYNRSRRCCGRSSPYTSTTASRNTRGWPVGQESQYWAAVS